MGLKYLLWNIAFYKKGGKFAFTFDTRSMHAKVAQLVEHDLAKVGVASSNLVFRSNKALLLGLYSLGAIGI
jgi:hypothetical protein